MLMYAFRHTTDHHLRRKVRSSVFSLAAFILLSAILCRAQSQTPTATAKLMISVPRPSYKVGETIEATITLENVGKEDFYLYRWLWRNFDIELRDDKEHSFCHVDAGTNCTGVKNKRGVETILIENFILLSPGDFVGTHWSLRTSCLLLPGSPKLPAGRYHVSASYDPNANCAPDLSKKHTNFPALQSTVEATPVQVELTQ
jgi:hypothetical protein